MERAPIPAAMVTDVTGRPVSPEGRRLIRDRRTPAEKAVSRADTILKAGEKIDKRKEEEKREWEDRCAMAQEKAQQEWETEEAMRRQQLERDLSERLMEEVGELRTQVAGVRQQAKAGRYA